MKEKALYASSFIFCSHVLLFAGSLFTGNLDYVLNATVIGILLAACGVVISLFAQKSMKKTLMISLNALAVPSYAVLNYKIFKSIVSLVAGMLTR